MAWGGVRETTSSSTRQGPRAFASATNPSSVRSSTARRSGSTSRNWNSISALPGITLGAPGSRVILPVVQTERGPTTAGKRSSIMLQNLTSATPASLRTGMRVVPA